MKFKIIGSMVVILLLIVLYVITSSGPGSQDEAVDPSATVQQ